MLGEPMESRYFVEVRVLVMRKGTFSRIAIWSSVML